MTNHLDEAMWAMTRRRMLKAAAAVGVGVAAAPFFDLAALGADGGGKKVLFLTKSQGFQHSVITRNPKDPMKLALAEQALTDIGAKAGYEVTVTKDADVFNDPETYKKYDVFAFYTTGDLTQPSDKKAKDGTLIHTEKPMSAEGKAMFLKAVEDGKGYLGFHCASDTFHSKNQKAVVRAEKPPANQVDPYIQLIGGEFVGHNSQQKSDIKFVGQGFPGLDGIKDFNMNEEWYGLRNFAPDLHVVFIQETGSMKVDLKTGEREEQYRRDPYPETWARNAGKGRVFYTSMGHRDEVWKFPTFVQTVTAALAWTSGNVAFDAKPNLGEVLPAIVAPKA